MSLHRRIFLYYSATLCLALAIIGFWSWFELNEHRDIFVQEGVQAALEHDILSETIEVVLYGGVPAILLGIVGGGILIARSLRPIAALTDALEKIDISNLSDPVPVPVSGRGDELDRMAVVFNQMKERLSLSFIQTREFTLNASHALKTPLTIMHATLERMITREEATGAQRESAISMLEEVQRLSSIVGQLSFLSRADAGQMPLNREPVALHELTQDLAEELPILASGMEISVTMPHCEPAVVLADRRSLRKLLLNLGDNAVKYNAAGGSIELGLRRTQGGAEFVITNTGKALSAELWPRVFDRFFRGDPAHHSAIEGSGLGLSIARSIVAAHGGKITYEVLPDGRTRVSVSLPSASAPKESDASRKMGSL